MKIDQATGGPRHININGHRIAVSPPYTISEALAAAGIPPATAVVEHNGRALSRPDWADTHVDDGDQLEILRISAGG